MTSLGRIGRIALWASPVVIVVVGFLTTAQWLKSIDELLMQLVGAAAAIFVMGYAVYVSIRCQRGQDEVQRASAGFAVLWGGAAGSIAFVLLMILPPFQTLLTDVVAEFEGGPGTPVDTDVVALSAMLGFMAVVLLQTIGTIVVNAIWWMRKQ